MTIPTQYISLDEALRIHAILIEAFGGVPGVRDLGLIEAALIRPQTGYYSGLIEEAAALWESLTMNHGFIDGNKRVGFACVELFLQSNGIDIVAENDEIETFIYANLEGRTFTKEVLEAWLNKRTGALE